MARKNNFGSWIKSPVYREFPQSGDYWWIRWIDGYQSHALSNQTVSQSSQRTVGIYLQKLNRNPHLLTDPSIATAVLKETHNTNAEQQYARLLSGCTPGLMMGSIYRRGSLVGQIQNEAQRFQIDLSDQSSHFRRVQEPLPKQPHWWRASSPCPTIQRKEYQVPNTSSWVLEFEDASTDRSLVIPCQEIFRFFYAPETKVVNALLSGPWGIALDQVVSAERTGVRPDGSLQVILRNGMHESSSMHVANLVLNEIGRRAANRVYASLFAEEGRIWNMKAEIPFGCTNFNIEVRVLPLQHTNGRHLCTEILGSDWPHQEHIHYLRETDPGEGRLQSKTDDTAPFSGPEHEFSPIDIDEFHSFNTSDEDPNARGPTVLHPARGNCWFNRPPMTKITKEESKKYCRIPGSSGDLVLDRTSTGKPHHGASSSTPGASVQENRVDFSADSRIQDVVRLVERLKEANVITDWKTLEPAKGSRFTLDTLPAWPLPNRLHNGKRTTYRPWAKLGDVPRCVLVTEISLKSGTQLMWFEVQPTPKSSSDTAQTEVQGKTFRSLIIRTHLHDVERERLIHELLRYCVLRNARWHSQSAFPVFTGLDSHTTWIHHRTTNPSELSLSSAAKTLAEMDEGLT